MRSFHRIFLSLLLVSSISLFGQTDTARLIGTITDASGAVVPGATVTVTNTGTGRAVTAQTSASGEYTVTPSGCLGGGSHGRCRSDQRARHHDGASKLAAAIAALH